MVKSGGIFRKQWLTPEQLRAVAGYRYDDANCLLQCGVTGDKARLTGAMYMGGFVVECLLKALLLDRHPNLQWFVDPAKLSDSDREVYAMLFGHDLAAMLDFVPEVEKKARAVNDTLWERFRTLCEEWTVYARYSPKLADKPQAERFIGTVLEVKEWLKEL